jgi:hypothetical protein
MPARSMTLGHSARRVTSGLGSLGTLPCQHRAVAIDDANRRLVERHVEPDEYTHGRLLMNGLIRSTVGVKSGSDYPG